MVWLSTAVPFGVEALVRYRDAEGTTHYPSEFYPALDDRMVADLGTLVMGAACQLAASLPDRLRLSVNVDPRELSDPGWPARVLDTVAEAGLATRDVMLELVERGRLDWETAAKPLAAVSEAGVGVALDDTGTGTNALHALQHLPVDEVKIDREFVHRIGQRRTDVIVQGLVDIAGQLRLPVVAEGIATARQAEALERWGVERGQGFLYSPPVPPEQLKAVLERLRAPEDDQVSAQVLARSLHEDGMSPPSIANVLNSQGYRTREGKRWHRTTVARLLDEG